MKNSTLLNAANIYSNLSMITANVFSSVYLNELIQYQKLSKIFRMLEMM